MPTHTDQPLDYASAGVDTAAGDKAVELMKAAVSRTMNTSVIGATGGFAGLVDASLMKDMKQPLLATSTDGVGTKIAIAQAMDIHDTIGQDLVGMVVDDIVVVGAKPLFMTDYIACGHVIPERIAAIVTGVARALEQVDCPLVGGETAEHPGVMAPDDYDIAGAATGVVDAGRMLGAERVKPGDVLVGMDASGLHSNGYSLVRRVVEVSGSHLEDPVADFGRTLGEELLEPTRLYTSVCLELLNTLGVEGLHALSHVTGGGIGANLARVIPAGLDATVERGTWRVPPVFTWVSQAGSVSWEALEDSLNLGIGMIAVVASHHVDEAIRTIRASGINAHVLGDVTLSNAPIPADARVISGTKGVHGGAVRLVGHYRAS